MQYLIGTEKCGLITYWERKLLINLYLGLFVQMFAIITFLVM